MTPPEVYDLSPPVYHAFSRHMKREQKAIERARKK
jgi:hypothetical protein